MAQRFPPAGIRSMTGMTLDPALRRLALSTKGFMPPDEGDALHSAAMSAAAAVPGAPFVEIGSYCGRSTIWLGGAARTVATTLFAVDHHRGSEENQPGWEHHDRSLVDAAMGVIDTLPLFRRTVRAAGLEADVVAVVGPSPVVARHWSTPLALLFIDGGHGIQPARDDYVTWTPHVAIGGTLAIHDVFPDPADGGRPPHEQIYVPAIASGRFALSSVTGSLRMLTRVA
jgi:MMP 1-O-methyltransferase